jgi:PadR family transcriptional regulator
MPILAIFAVMLQDPTQEWYGLEIAEQAGLKSGTLYPALMRLEKTGVLESSWEDVDPSEVGRPRRRLYRFTGEGERIARDARAQLRWIGEGGLPVPTPRARPA